MIRQIQSQGRKIESMGSTAREEMNNDVVQAGNEDLRAAETDLLGRLQCRSLKRLVRAFTYTSAQKALLPSAS